MEVMLVFLLGIFLTSMRSSEQPWGRRKDLILLACCVVVSVALLSHRLA